MTIRNNKIGNGNGHKAKKKSKVENRKSKITAPKMNMLGIRLTSQPYYQ